MINFWQAGLLVLTLLTSPKGDNVEGVWKPTQIELAGTPLPEAAFDKWRLELRKGKYTLTGAESPDSGTYAFDESKKPKTMDVTGVDGPNKGKTFPCIYELDGDTLRICYDLSLKERPKEFKTTRQTRLYLVTYQREKK